MRLVGAAPLALPILAVATAATVDDGLVLPGLPVFVNVELIAHRATPIMTPIRPIDPIPGPI